MPHRLIIGLMSGTSVDAIDAALVHISTTPSGRHTAKVLHHIEHPWPKQLRQRLLAIMAPATTTTQELCQLNTLVAHEFAQAVEQLLTASKTPRTKITALASHGQTICHLPPTQHSALSTQHFVPSTLQIGDPSTLATLTSIPTVANFRPADMALGGQGAPLVPWTDAVLLSHPTQTRCIQNIGGIANVTYLPRLSTKHSALSTSKILAFDTGPGNMLIDALISLATNGKKRYDQNGRLAAKGTLDPALLKKLQSHPYFRQPPPKSTGRELFGQHLAAKLLSPQSSVLSTLLATATRLTAWSIASAYARFLPTPPDEVILCGGGADNPTLTAMLTEELTTHFPTRPPKLSRIDDMGGGGIPNKAKEAASFALLAAATLDNVPANLPSVTGAARPTLLGVIAPARRPTR